jgi:hypothetical protein
MAKRKAGTLLNPKKKVRKMEEETEEVESNNALTKAEPSSHQGCQNSFDTICAEI